MTSTATGETTWSSPRARRATTDASGPSAGTATSLWNTVPGAAENDHTEILSTPILVDLDGNGVNDVAVGQAGEFYLLRGRDGARLYKPIEVNRIVQNSAAVADFGPGYGWRMIIQSWRPQGDGLPRSGSARVESFRLPKAPATAPAWPQWRLNANHTASPPLVAHTGYWIGLDRWRRLQLRERALLRLYRWPAPVAPGRCDDDHTVGSRLLARDARSAASTTSATRSRTARSGRSHRSTPSSASPRTPSGHGYWLVTDVGGVYNFGDAEVVRLGRDAAGTSRSPAWRPHDRVTATGS